MKYYRKKITLLGVKTTTTGLGWTVTLLWFALCFTFLYSIFTAFWAAVLTLVGPWSFTESLAPGLGISLVVGVLVSVFGRS